MRKKRSKRIVVTVGVDADTIFMLERIAENRSVQRAIVIREALNEYAEANNPFPQQIKEVIIREQSDRARASFPERFKTGEV